MIEEVNVIIRRANEAARRRHNARLAHRRPVQLLDAWLNQVETLVECKEPIVPEPLFGEIAGFLGKQDPLLLWRLSRNGKHDAVRVLNVLFEAEEQFLPAMARTP